MRSLTRFIVIAAIAIALAAFARRARPAVDGAAVLNAAGLIDVESGLPVRFTPGEPTLLALSGRVGDLLEDPRLQELHETYAPLGLRVLVVASESREALRAALAQRQLTMHGATTEGEPLLPGIAREGWMTVILLDRGGAVAHLGRPSSVEPAIRRALGTTEDATRAGPPALADLIASRLYFRAVDGMRDATATELASAVNDAGLRACCTASAARERLLARRALVATQWAVGRSMHEVGPAWDDMEPIFFRPSGFAESFSLGSTLDNLLLSGRALPQTVLLDGFAVTPDTAAAFVRQRLARAVVMDSINAGQTIEPGAIDAAVSNALQTEQARAEKKLGPPVTPLAPSPPLR